MRFIPPCCFAEAQIAVLPSASCIALRLGTAITAFGIPSTAQPFLVRCRFHTLEDFLFNPVVCRLDIFSISMLPVHRWRYSLDLRPAVVPSSFWCITRDWINFHGDWMPLPIHQFGDEIHLQETVEALPVTT